MDAIFKVGEKVKFMPDLHERHYGGAFEVVACLPAEKGERHYRIRSLSDGHVRSVNEAQLQPYPAANPGS